jgi:hypothetical protein
MSGAGRLKGKEIASKISAARRITTTRMSSQKFSFRKVIQELKTGLDT